MIRMLRYFLVFIGILFSLIIFLLAYIKWGIEFDPPAVNNSLVAEFKLIKEGDIRTVQTSWLRQDESQVWEMYLEGSPYQRGYAAGMLYQDLLAYQEEVFVEQIEKMISVKLERSLLQSLAKFFNRNIQDFIPNENQQEIYGVSQFASHDFEDLGTNFERKLIYHGAHDVGHAFQNLGFVSGCSAFTARDSLSQDLLLGRNFDFYVGDAFAKNKIIACVRPDTGWAYISVTWPGMTGIVSGMNDAGLACVINAGPGHIPKGVRTPVTLIARHIVQYATTIEEAIAIAKSFDVFVSENFIVVSGKEMKSVVIEKQPGKTTIVSFPTTNLMCTNHFQSEENQKNAENLVAIAETSTDERYAKLKQIQNVNSPSDIHEMINVLRSTTDENNVDLGMGNEGAINQIKGHHSVIFNVNKKIMYFAGVPAQIGPYLAYSLDSIFTTKYTKAQRLWIDSIPADPRLYTADYSNFKRFEILKDSLIISTDKNIVWSSQALDRFIALNPHNQLGYILVGGHLVQTNRCQKALPYLNAAFAMPAAWKKDVDEIQALLTQCASSN